MHRRDRYTLDTIDSDYFTMFFGLGGSNDEMSTNDLPGKQERVHCDAKVPVEVMATDSHHNHSRGRNDENSEI